MKLTVCPKASADRKQPQQQARYCTMIRTGIFFMIHEQSMPVTLQFWESRDQARLA